MKKECCCSIKISNYLGREMVLSIRGCHVSLNLVPQESALNKSLECLAIPGLEGQTRTNPWGLLEVQSSRISISGFSVRPCLKQQGGDPWRHWPCQTCTYTFHFPPGLEIWARIKVLLPDEFTRCLWHGAGFPFFCISFCELTCV